MKNDTQRIQQKGRQGEITSQNKSGAGQLEAGAGRTGSKARKGASVIGERFGRLVVISRAADYVRADGRRDQKFLCHCDCGQRLITHRQTLLSGATRSCGCLQKELAAKRAVTHGATVGGIHTRAYRIWRGMLQRCRDKRQPNYKKYGALGVRVCSRWENFENFITDMGECPSEKHSIDRHPNYSGDYEPGNCRWATGSEQANNKRNNRFIEFKGSSYTARQLSLATGVNYALLRERIWMLGWSAEAAVNTPPRKRRNK